MGVVANLADHHRERLLAKLRDQRAELSNIYRSICLLQEAMDPTIDEIERLFTHAEWHDYDRYLHDLWGRTRGEELSYVFAVLNQAIKTLEYDLFCKSDGPFTTRGRASGKYGYGD